MDVPDPPAIVEDPHEVPVGKRVSAAARVAGELRSRYAVSATL
jgi:hypothetical protein